MDMTVVTVVHGTDTLTYTALEPAQKEKLIGDIVHQGPTLRANIPALTTGAIHTKQELPLDIRTVTSIAFTFTQ